MELLTQCIILITSLAILGKSAHIATNKAYEIAKITGLGGIVIGLIVLSVIVNLPELSIAFSSIFLNQEDIALGNIFGSNIANATWNIGLIAIFFPMIIYKKTVKELSKILFLASAICLFSLIYVSRILGLVLVMTLLAFCYFSAKKRIELGKPKRRGKIKFSKILSLALSLIVVVLSSEFIVSSSANIATLLNVSKTVIGATVISIGTTIPEFVVGFVAVRKGYVSLALGGILGSLITKVTLILGLLLLISPAAIDLTFYSTLVGFMIFSVVLVWFFFGRGKIDRIDGLFLIIVYVLFLLTIFGVEIVF